MLRHDEVYEALAVMKEFHWEISRYQGLLPQQLSIGLLAQWEGTFDPEELYMAGHSMGGGACVSYSAWHLGTSFMILQVYVLSNGAPEGFDLSPAKQAVMFDVSVVRHPVIFSDS